MSHLDALVVGAGPTGLFLAHELARQGARLRLVDKLPSASDKSKAFAIHSRTLEAFDTSGLAEGFVAAGGHIGAVNLYADGKRLAHVAFEGLPTRFPYILSLPQSQTEALLVRLLAARGVTVERSVELTSFEQDGASVWARLRHADGPEEAVVASYLVGCDGAHSTVRHALGFGFEGAPYAESFGLADVRLDWKLPPSEMHIFLGEAGPFFALGFGGDRYRLIAALGAPAGAGTGLGDAMSQAEWEAILAERGPKGARLSEPAWMSRFHIHRRHVNRLRSGRVFLAGDAAHIHSPAGGQGMNTGLQDVHNLAWKLALALRGAPAALLDSYEAERLPIQKRVVMGTDALTRVGLLANPVVRSLRNHLVPLLIGFAQRKVTGTVSELDINYRQNAKAGAFIEEHRLPAGPRAGDHAPDGALELGGTAHRLYELLRHGGHTLLLFAGEKPTEAGRRALAALAERVSAGYPSWISLAPIEVKRGSFERPAALDPRAALHRRYGASKACVYLLRPDGYVGFRGPAGAGKALASYLSRLFGPPKTGPTGRVVA